MAWIEGYTPYTIVAKKERQGDFRRHIADCYECNIFLDTYAKAIAITDALQCADIPAALQDKIKTFISRPAA